ncbi:MAG TPA: leucine--tRNA ligase [Candidatus Pacearchaeota archaeon]|nr:leucine--tRNA ligase [Candidatus Pacearchaeota archaeon]HPZ74222.1 leucine--tRNA ligase [Candidatus Pacearchaeota archaeon]HQD88894.1 leucine--tRNA ligase [Candidatus Pacearchaeota archaeon]
MKKKCNHKKFNQDKSKQKIKVKINSEWEEIHYQIEKKWQQIWKNQGTFKAKNTSKKPKFYCLDMFPYPSAYGLHVGHLKGYTFSDLITKKKKMEGFNVLHPMGFDAFGLPAENFAIKTGIHPAITTKKAISNIKKQLVFAGMGYDWEREIITCKPEYYKWTQWMFLQLYKAGLAYKKKAPVNFCPSCKTVLANEQVIEEKCERCSSIVEKRYLEQWFLKITDYAERLLKDLDKIDWPEKIKIMQKNWIGKSEGTEISFQLTKNNLQLKVFTTRTDTIFGCTYVVIAPEHPLIEQCKSKIENFNEIQNYIQKSKNKSEIERTSESKTKTGIKIKGIKAINPVNKKEIPIFVADYVLMEYGTGAVMGVPAHDERDFAFADRYQLPIKTVIVPRDKSKIKNIKISKNGAFIEDGILINSGIFTGLSSNEARQAITQYLAKIGKAKKSTYYRLRDWLVSRQRYWGAPIPIIYCKDCGEVPVPEKDLPVKLPRVKDFKPSGDGKSPLTNSKTFVNTICPKCGKKAKRETDTLDTFVCSSWYFLRYTDPKNKRKPFEKTKIKKWLPVDLYIGGAEHAVMHLLYARFFTKALKDLGYLDFSEPFSKLFNQGTIYYKGAKMSKSRGNVIRPDEIIKKYGSDTIRVYELFMGPADQSTEWSDRGVVGCYRFLQRVWNLQEKIQNPKSKTQNQHLQKLLHKTIKKVSEDIENFRFNTAVSSLMILTNQLEKEKEISKEYYEILIKLLSPMAPHITEELWQRLHYKNKTVKRVLSIFDEKWPTYDLKIVEEEKITLVVQVNGKKRDIVEVNKNISQKEIEKLIFQRENVKKYLQGKKVKKIIFVPKRLINILV